jgi:hypothetical protein
MADIKSASDIAREKLANIGESTEEERFRWQYIPKGKKLAVSYLAEEINLATELSKYEAEAKRYVMVGVEKVLIANINLPKNEILSDKNEKVLGALLEIISDKQKLKEVVNKIKQVFNHY